MRTAGQGPGGFEKRDGFIKPGQDLVVAGFAGLAGTRQIFQEKRENWKGILRLLSLDVWKKKTATT
mgnify:CR=1 FL=1